MYYSITVPSSVILRPTVSDWMNGAEFGPLGAQLPWVVGNLGHATVESNFRPAGQNSA